ncbi:MAG: hypothetical protein HY512_03055 [Candidatus Aenigmarchaeota archaeon]|nr:hypothetical protein [Candidatus Aenigmarchaeota archaeon]
MKGAEPVMVVILFAGALIVAIVIMLMFHNVAFSGFDAKKANEDATLGYQLVNMVNILDTNERGNITQELVASYKIEVLEDGGKTKLKVGDRYFTLLSKVKPTSFVSRKGIIVSKDSGGIAISNLA